MRALAVKQNGPGRKLELTELPVPSPGPGEITIDVAAAGVGLIDAFWASGAMPQHEGFVPGLEVAGTVREIGAGVDGFAPGQTVAAITLGAGGFAEVARVSGSLAVDVPAGMDLDRAAVVPVNTVTAHLALTTVGRLVEGESVLVHAGVGGLGSQFGQIARALGAGRVDAVVGSEAKRDLALSLGYDNVYARGDLASVPEGTYDAVVDSVGGDATSSAFAALRSGGRLVRVGNASQAPDQSLSSLAHWLENKSTVGFNIGAWLTDHPEQGRDSLRWALDSVHSGDIEVQLAHTASLEEHAPFFAALLGGETTGKVVLLTR